MNCERIANVLFEKGMNVYKKQATVRVAST